MMAFENVGFSRPLAADDKGGGTGVQDQQINLPAGLRYLCCADCEMGPIGFNITGQELFYVAADRVRYKKPV